MSKKIRAAVVGTGRRAANYFRHIPDELKDRVELVALADPSKRNRDAFARLYATSKPVQHYEDGRQLLESEHVDALVVCSPNREHAAVALTAIAKGIPLLLEKPVATDVHDCAKLWRTYLAAGCPPVTVGFVLRYTPFYLRAREIVESGVLGQVLTVDGDEDIGTATTRLFFGSWRRWDEQTGGFMIEKCSHDLDVLRWLTKSEALSVSSVARRSHLLSQPPKGRLVRFEAVPSGGSVGVPAQSMEELLSQGEAGSLYDSGGDIPDHQSAIIEWENGTISCFTSAFARPRTTRRLRIGGVEGMLEGDIGLGRLSLETIAGDREDFLRQDITIDHDDSGHHGGDGNLAAQFWHSCMRPEDWQPPLAGLREGLEAVLIGAAIHQAAITGQQQNVRALRRRVFDNLAQCT